MEELKYYGAFSSSLFVPLKTKCEQRLPQDSTLPHNSPFSVNGVLLSWFGPLMPDDQPIYQNQFFPKLEAEI